MNFFRLMITWLRVNDECERERKKNPSEDGSAYEIKTNGYRVRIRIQSDPVLFLYGGWHRLSFTLQSQEMLLQHLLRILV